MTLLLNLIFPFVSALLAAQDDTTRPFASDQADAWVTVGQELAQRLNARNPDVEKTLLDISALVETSLRGLDLPAGYRQTYVTQVVSRFSLRERLDGVFGKSWKMKFLRIRMRDAQPHALLRMSAEGKFNYYEFLIKKDSAGRLRSPDAYVYANGERISDTLRRFALPLIVRDNAALLTGLGRTDADYLANVEKIEKMQELGGSGKMADALAIYRSLPESVRQEASVLLLRLRLASGDPAEFAQAVEVLRRKYPDDGTSDYLALDGQILIRDLQGALATIDRLDEAIGGDPFLDYHRALVHQLAGDLTQAKNRLRRCVTNDPAVAEAYWQLLAISLQERDFETTAQLLDEMEIALQIEFKDLSQLPAYAEFAKSEAYRRWKSRREAVPDREASAGDPLWIIPVVTIKYFPVKGDRIDVDVTGDWGETLEATRRKVEHIQTETIASLEQGSRFRAYKNPAAPPSLGYRIVHQYEFLEPLPTISPAQGTPMTDYNAIMARVEAEKWIQGKGVKEFWIWAYHGGKVGPSAAEPHPSEGFLLRPHGGPATSFQPRASLHLAEEFSG
ncbi:MAG: hypothetical protein AB1486_22050 [Planctomycetota bacterium]